MPGDKNKSELADAAASFFGEDDLDWFEDEDEEGLRAASLSAPSVPPVDEKPPEAVEAAPPGPVLDPPAPEPVVETPSPEPFVAASSPEPVETPSPEPLFERPGPEAFGGGLSIPIALPPPPPSFGQEREGGGPTMVPPSTAPATIDLGDLDAAIEGFAAPLPSQVPTILDPSELDDEPEPPVRPGPAFVDLSVPVDLGPPPPAELIAEPMTEETFETEEIPEAIVEELEEAEPRVYIQTPPPARVRSPLPAEPQAPPVMPSTAGDWAAAVASIEAAVRAGADDGALVEAARFAFERLADPSRAEAVLADARLGGDEGLELAASVAVAQSRWTDLIALLGARADLFGGEAAADLRREAATVALRRLDDHNEAIEQLQAARAADPNDLASLTLLREQLAAQGLDADRIEVLEAMASLVGDRAAADLYWERGLLLRHAGRTHDAREAFELARAADPGHDGAFLALEAMLVGRHDDVALAGLYEEEGTRSEGPARAWWLLQAARAYRHAGQETRSELAFRESIAHGGQLAARELRNWLESRERYADLAGILEAQVASSSEGRDMAVALFHLGWVRERRLGQRQGAIEAYRQAAEQDPAAVPAREAIARLLASEDANGLAAFLEERLETTIDPQSAIPDLLRLAELAEAAGPADDACLAAWQRLLDLAPEHLLGLEGLVRALRRRGDAALVDALERLGRVSTDPRARADRLSEAGFRRSVAGDAEGALGCYIEALEADPGHGLALDAVVAALELAGDTGGVIDRLEAAAAATASYGDTLALRAYQGARRLRDTEGASERVGRLAEAAGELGSARDLVVELAGADRPETLNEEYRQRANAAEEPSVRSWLAIAAAILGADAGSDLVASDLEMVLGDDPTHAEALALIERAVAPGGHEAILALRLRLAEDLPATSAAEVRLSVAERLLGDGRDDEAMQQLDALVGADPGVLHAGSRLAARVGRWEVAARLLEGMDTIAGRLERARILDSRLGDVSEALLVHEALLEQAPDDAVVGMAAARAASAAGDLGLAERAHLQVAAHAELAPARAAHALWAASLVESRGDHASGLAAWRQLLTERPASIAGFEGALRCALATSDGEAVRDLFAAHRPEDLRGLARALERVGAAAALETWQVAASEPTLADTFVLESLLTEAEDWGGVFAVLTARTSLLAVDDPTRAAVDARKRWLLAEKLADTDQAWELYRQLHEEDPADRAVTEALARIAGARGEIALAVQYLEALAEGAEPEEAARYHWRIGEIHERAGDADQARQSWLNALDFSPTDRGALEGLQRLARADEDWPALVAALQRDVSLQSGEERIEVLREIARITEQHLGDPGVAADAWRSVLDASSTDREALEHSLALAEAGERWDAVLEFGAALAGVVDESERAALCQRMGLVARRAGRDQDALAWLERGFQEGGVDLDAASVLEAIHRDRSDWGGVIRALVLQAQALEDESERARRLEEAARIELEQRHDKAAAAAIYTTLLESSPEHEGALRFQASWLFDAGRFEDAVDVCARLEPFIRNQDDLEDFDVRMDVSLFYFRFAEMLRQVQREADAIARFEQALELNPTHLPSLEAVGPLYIESRSWRKAEAVYRQVLQLTGGHGDRRKVADAYTNLGTVERALGAEEKAYKRFNKALEIQPNYVPALKGLALILEDRQDWNTLLVIYNNVIHYATVPGDVIDAYMTKGRILDQHMNRPDKAIQHYERSLAFDPNQPGALLRLAELAMRRDEWSEVGDLARRGLHLAGEPGPVRADLLVALAGSRQSTGDDTAARAALEEAREAWPPGRESVPDDLLGDLSRLRAGVHQRLPA